MYPPTRKDSMKRFDRFKAQVLCLYIKDKKKKKQRHSKVGKAKECTINAIHYSPTAPASSPLTSLTLITFTPLSQVPMAVLSSKEHQATTLMVTLAVASSPGHRTGPIASIEDICAKKPHENRAVKGSIGCQSLQSSFRDCRHL